MIDWDVAQRLFGAEQAVGRQISLAGTPQPVEVVGVVGDVKHRALDETALPTHICLPGKRLRARG